MEKYFVISLPRTGTTSICRMAKECGLNISHAPNLYFNRRLKENFDFYADTPIFCPDIIEDIIRCENVNSKFIFIKRDFNLVFSSWINVGLYKNYISMYNSNFEKLKPTQQYDLMSYNKAFDDKKLDETNFKNIFEEHENKVISLVKSSNKELLTYDFNNGWQDFCNFIKKDIPNMPIPHLNKNYMYDKI